MIYLYCKGELIYLYKRVNVLQYYKTGLLQP